MKLQSIADKSLKEMVKEYHASGKQLFMNDFFLNLFPEENPEHLYNAIALLENDGFINTFYADGIPYSVSLITSGIRDCEENTLLKKGYVCIKEIKSLIC